MPHKLFDVLKRDHRQVEKWMTQIAEGSPGKRADIFETLQDALQKHMQMEEKLFYPEAQKFGDLKDIVKDGIEEHTGTRKFISQLNGLSVDSKEWMIAFSEMRQGVLHHVQDEEKKLFPGCTKQMPAQLLQRIGEKVTEMKEKDSSRRT